MSKEHHSAGVSGCEPPHVERQAVPVPPSHSSHPQGIPRFKTSEFTVNIVNYDYERGKSFSPSPHGEKVQVEGVVRVFTSPSSIFSLWLLLLCNCSQKHL